MINETAQWALLLFLTVYSIGLTRQLGHFLSSGRENRSASEGPDLNRALPRGFLLNAERDHLQDLATGRKSAYAAIVTMDERCSGCDQMVEQLETIGLAERTPLMIVARKANAEHHERLKSVADIVVVDEQRFDKADLSITPFTMLLDEDLRLVAKAIATPVDALIAKHREESQHQSQPADGGRAAELALSGRNRE